MIRWNEPKRVGLGYKLPTLQKVCQKLLIIHCFYDYGTWCKKTSKYFTQLSWFGGAPVVGLQKIWMLVPKFCFLIGDFQANLARPVLAGRFQWGCIAFRYKLHNGFRWADHTEQDGVSWLRNKLPSDFDWCKWVENELRHCHQGMFSCFQEQLVINIMFLSPAFQYNLILYCPRPTRTALTLTARLEALFPD